MNKSSESYKVYTEQKSGDCTSGVIESQTENHGQNYPGRALPLTETVKDAETKSGVAKKCCDQQVGENRLYLNKHEECKNTEKGCE